MYFQSCFRCLLIWVGMGSCHHEPKFQHALAFNAPIVIQQGPFIADYAMETSVDQEVSKIPFFVFGDYALENRGFRGVPVNLGRHPHENQP